MNQKEARILFTKLFGKGVFKNGFREACTGPTSGKVVGSFIYLESSKYSEDQLREIVSKQKEL